MEYGIVLGVPRSGTTFLMRYLDGTPRTECVSGNLVPIAIPHLLAQDLSPTVTQVLMNSLEGSLAEYVTSGLYCSRSAALRKWYRAGGALSCLPDVIRGRRNEDLLIYKEPFFSFSPYSVAQALPQAQLLYVYRDGRDVANSLVATYNVLTDERLRDLKAHETQLGRRREGLYIPWWIEDVDADVFLASSPYLRAILMWRAMVRRCNSCLNGLDMSPTDSNRILRIRYEELMREPLRVGRSIYAHFGLTMTHTARRTLAKAHTRSIGAYRRREPSEIARAEDLAADELREYGYLQ